MTRDEAERLMISLRLAVDHLIDASVALETAKFHRARAGVDYENPLATIDAVLNAKPAAPTAKEE